MFTLIESKTEIAKAQRKLEATIRREFPRKITKNIGYPGGTTHNAKVSSNGTCWHWSADYDEQHTPNPRRLNWFGLLNKDADLQITAEINTAYEGRNDQIAGFFARDNETGRTYLMHSGRVGGGTRGVGKAAYLTWSNQTPVEVVDASGGIKEGVLVMPIDGVAATRPAVRYIESIASFKQAVRGGEMNSPEFQERKREFDDYFSESHGRRQGRRSSVIDYLSRHGEVVDELYAWRNSSALPRRGRLVKNILIDLGVVVNGKLVEVYEVKTSTTRSAIYTAIGQLMVHGTAEKCHRFMVLPGAEALPADLHNALQRLDIELLRFTLDEDSVTIA